MTTRFVAFDLRSGVQLGEVPLGGVSYKERLNADHELTGRVDLAERTTTGLSLGKFYREMLRPGRTKLCVVHDDGRDPISFIVKGRDYDGDRFLNIRCKGIWSYHAEYPLKVRKSYADAEQFDVARDLINWVEAQPSSDVRLRVESVTDSGIRRTVAYDGFERRPVGEIVAELATSEDGFEYSIVSSGGVSAVVDTWTPHYPQQGSSFVEEIKVISLARLPATLRLTERQPVTTLELLGAGEGADMLIQPSTSQALLSDGYPELPATVAFKSEANSSALLRRARGEHATLNRRRKTWTITAVRDTDRYEFTNIGVGDEVKIEVPPGVDRLYPEGLTLAQRVVARGVTLSDAGVETITWELGDTASSIPSSTTGPPGTYRVVGTGDSILAMSWGFSSPGGVYTNSDHWLDFEHGRAPYTTGLAHRYSTAGIWPKLLTASQADGWIVVQDNSLGTDSAGWTSLMTTIRDDCPDDRWLLAVLPGYLASVNAGLAATIAANAATMQAILSGHPRAVFVDLAAYMGANPSQFPDGQHPDATAQAWIRSSIETLTG